MHRAVAAGAALAAVWIGVHIRSPAVCGWQDPDLRVQRLGALAYGAIGPQGASTGVVLLHGLVASGAVFGRTPHLLSSDHRVVVPDLLGFGQSMDETRTDFSTAAHLEALVRLVDHELDGRPFRIGAHSMGSALALRLAAAYPARVERVVCLAPPIWATPAAARAGLGALGPMARALMLDRRIASRLCQFNCRHRRLAGVLAAATSPRWPVPIARQASLHSWEAYIQALEDQIIDCRWADLIEQALASGVTVHLVRGRDDPIGDLRFISRLAKHPAVELLSVAGDHSLPAAIPGLLERLLDR